MSSNRHWAQQAARVWGQKMVRTFGNGPLVGIRHLSISLRRSQKTPRKSPGSHLHLFVSKLYVLSVAEIISCIPCPTFVKHSLLITQLSTLSSSPQHLNAKSRWWSFLESQRVILGNFLEPYENSYPLITTLCEPRVGVQTMKKERILQKYK